MVSQKLRWKRIPELLKPKNFARSDRAELILSVGIQSFNSQHLASLGRIHNGDEAKRAIDIAKTHFDNFNLDLMFALPGQTLTETQQDIEMALSFAPPHLSLYHLTLEPNTYFAKYPPAIPDDDTSAEMQELIHAKMAGAGYVNYEVSAYAQPGKASRHNQNYWNFGDYLGIGAGAHSNCRFHIASFVRPASNSRKHLLRRVWLVMQFRSRMRSMHAICHLNLC
jgi:putative oxygen-independent coproporphyrinogen III oxidase